MMEAVRTSETSVCATRLHGAISQKAIIFVFMLYQLQQLLGMSVISMYSAERFGQTHEDPRLRHVTRSRWQGTRGFAPSSTCPRRPIKGNDTAEFIHSSASL